MAYLAEFLVGCYLSMVFFTSLYWALKHWGLRNG